MIIRTLNNDRGMAMAIVLAILVMLGFIGAAAVRNSSTEMDITEALTERTKAFFTAEAGLELAIAKMRANPTMTAVDSLLYIINQDTALGSGSFEVEMSNGYPVRTVASAGYESDGEAAGSD